MIGFQLLYWIKECWYYCCQPATFVGLGDFSDPTVLLGFTGILLALRALFAVGYKISKFALLLSILITAIVGLVLGWIGVAGYAIIYWWLQPGFKYVWPNIRIGDGIATFVSAAIADSSKYDIW